MSQIRCPNCHADVFGDTCSSCGFKVGLRWVCPECGAEHYFVGQKMQFCPVCRAKEAEIERQWWDNKRVGMRSVTDDIVAKALGK